MIEGLLVAISMEAALGLTGAIIAAKNYFNSNNEKIQVSYMILEELEKYRKSL